MPVELSDIKAQIEENLGRKVVVTSQIGRKKKKERLGTLANSYPAVFTVELEQVNQQFDCVSYSYTDILTDTIEIEFVDEEETVKG